MDQFDQARIRAEKLEAKRVRYQPISEESQKLRSGGYDAHDPLSGTLHLPKPEAPALLKVKPPKAPVKRTNEIAMKVYVDGAEMDFTAYVNFNDIIASQRTRPNLLELFKSAFRLKFGRVDMK